MPFSAAGPAPCCSCCLNISCMSALHCWLVLVAVPALPILHQGACVCALLCHPLTHAFCRLALPPASICKLACMQEGSQHMTGKPWPSLGADLRLQVKSHSCPVLVPRILLCHTTKLFEVVICQLKQLFGLTLWAESQRCAEVCTGRAVAPCRNESSRRHESHVQGQLIAPTLLTSGSLLLQ